MKNWKEGYKVFQEIDGKLRPFNTPYVVFKNKELIYKEGVVYKRNSSRGSFCLFGSKQLAHKFITNFSTLSCSKFLTVKIVSYITDYKPILFYKGTVGNSDILAYRDAASAVSIRSQYPGTVFAKEFKLIKV